MRKRTVLALTGIVGLTGCGSGGTKTVTVGAGAPTTTVTTSKDQQSAVEVALREWIDDDNCALMSERYAAEGYESAEDGRAACRKETSKGLRKGEYTIRSTDVTGNSATVVVPMNSGGMRTYTMVKEDGAWKVDNFVEKLVGKIGDTFTLSDSYEQDGSPVVVDVRVTVLAVKDHAAPVPYTTTRPAHRWIRVKIRLRSRSASSFSQSTADFAAVDTAGHRYQPDGSAFDPTLGNGGVDLTTGDVVVGYEGFELPDSAKLASIRLNHVGDTAGPLVWRTK